MDKSKLSFYDFALSEFTVGGKKMYNLKTKHLKEFKKRVENAQFEHCFCTRAFSKR